MRFEQKHVLAAMPRVIFETRCQAAGSALQPVAEESLRLETPSSRRNTVQDAHVTILINDDPSLASFTSALLPLCCKSTTVPMGNNMSDVNVKHH